jgi:putative ABC transport system permease protein
MRALLRRLTYLLRWRRLEAELAEELELHEILKRQEMERAGLGANDAQMAARRAVGNGLLARDQARDVWIAPWLQDLLGDVRMGARRLARDRGVTIVVVLALGLGIGVNTAQFTIVNAHCLRGLPIDRPDRVLFLTTLARNGQESGVSWPDLRDLRASTRTLEGLAGFTTDTTAIGDDGLAVDRTLRTYVSGNLFDLMGERPLLGRSFRASDDRAGAEPVAILSHRLWQSRYQGDRTVLGRRIGIGGTTVTIVGVLRDGFRFPANTDVWQPLALDAALTAQGRETRSLSVVGRLADRGSIGDARAELESLAASLAREHPANNAATRPKLIPINDRYNADIMNPAWLAFMAVGGLVVIIACANVANLLLMRTARRSGELALRGALGASRRRILRQLLVENALLAVAGSLAGLGMSAASVRLLAAAIPKEVLPFWVQYTVDGRVLMVVVVVCAATILLFGLVPALCVDTSQMETNRIAGRGRRVTAWSAVLMTVEFGLTVVLLAAVVLSIRVALAADREGVTIEGSHLLTMWVTLPQATYSTGTERMAFFEQLNARLSGIPGVSAAGVASALPLGGAEPRKLVVDGRAMSEPESTAWTIAVDPGYFETIGVPVMRGRPFTSLDGAPGHASVIVNARLAERYFGTGDAIGRRIRLVSEATGETGWLTIVGVSPNIKQRPLPRTDPIVYLPLRQSPPATAALMLRAPSNVDGLAALARAETAALDRNLPIYRVLTLDQYAREAGWNGRVSDALINGIAAIALLLATIGLYAVTAYAVSMRTKEIGIRVALGARRGQIIRLVLRRVFVHVAAGFIVGVACTWTWGHFMGTGPGSTARLTDPATLSGVAVLLIAAGLAAAIRPVSHATHVQPVEALRHE